MSRSIGYLCEFTLYYFLVCISNDPHIMHYGPCTVQYCTYDDLESIEQRGSISQTAILVVVGVVLGHVSIRASAQEHLLYVTDKGISQVLDWIHHHSAIDHIPWEEISCELIQ